MDVDKRNITEMSFDEIFPEQNFPQPDSKSTDHQASFDINNNTVSSANADNGNDYSLPDNRYASSEYSGVSAFTENAYSFNEAAAPDSPERLKYKNKPMSSDIPIPPPVNRPNPLSLEKDDNGNSEKVSYSVGAAFSSGTNKSSNTPTAMIMGVLSIILCTVGFGLIFAVIGLVLNAKENNNKTDDEKQRSDYKAVNTICIIGLCVNLLFLGATMFSSTLGNILSFLIRRII